MKVGILTSGGDCQGLNAVIRAIVLGLKDADKDNIIYGITNGYRGLIDLEYSELNADDVRGVISDGGSMLHSSRTMFKKMLENEHNEIERIKQSYKQLELDCLFTLGGAGTHKMANLLSMEGLNIIGLPKTIDNDIFGTDITFGFTTAVGIASECIERIRTTARSHYRVFVVEIMGNKAGWLTLNAGIAGGADVILIPEMPYDPDAVVSHVQESIEHNDGYAIVAIAEGAKTIAETKLSKSERETYASSGRSASTVLSEYISQKLEVDSRVFVAGHLQRGGDPCAFDKVLCSQLGIMATHLALSGKFGTTVSVSHGRISYNMLSEIAGKAKLVPKNHQLINTAKALGVSFGKSVKK